MKYESIEQKILRIIYPPVLYLFICIGTQFVVSTILISSDIKNTDVAGINASASAGYMDHINKMIAEHSVLMNCISATIGLIIFGIILKKDFTSEKDFSIKKCLKEIKIENLLNAYGIGLTAATGISLFVSILPIDNIIGSYETTSELLLNGDFIYLFVVLGIIVPLTEEIIYRGLIYNRVKKYLDVNKAILISSLLFGIFHFNLMQGVYAFIIGIIMGYLYHKYNSILAPVALHMAVNQLTVIFNCTGISNALNGNIIIYIMCMVISLAIGVFLIFRTIKS